MGEQAQSHQAVTCAGPLIWYDVEYISAKIVKAGILHCARCGYIVITTGWNDEAHSRTPVLMEGLA